MGGPNYPYTLEKRKTFSGNRQLLDFYVFHEGEVGFNNLIRACLKHNLKIKSVKAEEISGCHYLRDGKLITGKDVEWKMT